MSAMGELTLFLSLQALQKKHGIFLSQDKYVGDILKKFGYSDVRHQVTPKGCHLYAVKRIFRYLKGHPKLGLWYPKESPFDLVAYSDSDYGGATQDRKSTSRGCQFLGRRLISWQCKKQTIVATSTTEAEYVAAASGCRQFWSTARIETTNQETKILTTVDGKLQTIYKSSLRRHLKLNDEDRISSLPDAKLFEILSLMGYNILPKQSNIATAVVCLATNRVYNFSKMIFDGMDEGSVNPTEPYHIPSPQELHSPHHDSLPPSRQPIISEPLPQAPTKTLTHRKYTKKAIRIAQSKALSPATDEPASLLRDDRQGEAFPTISSLDAGQDRKNIAKTSALPHESSPRVSSLDADEGSMQQRIHELMDLCTILQRQQSQMVAKIKDQDLKISRLKAIIKSLKDKERKSVEPTQEDAPITRQIKDIGEDLGADKSIELGSNDTEEMVNVLISMEAVNILKSGGATASVSPADVLPAAGVLTVSESFSTVSAIFTTASVVTPYTRRSRGITIGSSHPMRIPIIGAKDKGKEKRLSEQLARDSEIARLHAEEDLKMTIEGLDRSNEVIAKHLREYEQAKAGLSIRDKLELISELVKYQDHRAKILKYQALQSKPLSKKEKRKFYMSYEDFVPMSSKEENHKVKKQGLMIDQGSSKRMKISQGASKEELKGMMQLVPLEEVYIEALHVKHPIIDWEIHSEGKREYWKIIRLGGHTTVYQFFVDMLKQFDREDLYQLWTLVKETFSTKQATRDKEKELWVELKRMFEPDFED
uniref:Putative ribonuclease H-like domain-containing protein n=1 Tax=Tanacetum cinerariifolium TaxID=118510 RepID=A0A6L2J805_TANCI|nr:putative ribonuclease H-like domain-containing protein [Tanacetum cinerariifolium]